MAAAFLFSVPIPSKRGRNRALYMTQVGVMPPSFAVFVKEREDVPESFTRYLLNKILSHPHSLQGKMNPTVLRIKEVLWEGTIHFLRSHGFVYSAAVAFNLLLASIPILFLVFAAAASIIGTNELP